MLAIDQIYNHLKEQGSITSWEAIQVYRNTRLAEYIRQLRKDKGLEIKSTWKKNNGKRFVEYSIVNAV